MKKIILFLLLMFINVEFSQHMLQSCPTCVGNATETGVPFFSDECYLSLDPVDFSSTTTKALLEKREEAE